MADDAMDVDATSSSLVPSALSPSPPPHQSPLPASSPPPSHPSRHLLPPDPAAITSARHTVAVFLQNHLTEELVPTNSRVVVIESSVRLSHAFRSLLDNGVRAAPIVETLGTFTGMLTVSDFSEALRVFYRENAADRNVHRGLESHTVASWRARAGGDGVFRYIDAEASLFDACRMLRDMHIHRLPILAGGNLLLCTLEHWRVLSFVNEHLVGQERVDAEEGVDGEASGGAGGMDEHAAGVPAADLFSLNLDQLALGTFGNMITINQTDSLLTTLDAMAQHNLSAVPIVDNDGILRNVYSRSDITVLARAGGEPINLDQTVLQALTPIRSQEFVVDTCRRWDTLRVIFQKFEVSRKHRLYVVGEHGHVEGVLSLSDVLAYFLAA